MSAVEPAGSKTSPVLDGLHHLKVAVSDLTESLAWWEKVMGAQRQPDWDHVDRNGLLFAYILLAPGLDTPVELRRDSAAAKAMSGFDPISFGVTTHHDLELWVAHLDELGVDHSPILRGLIGWMLVVPGPDGLSIRLYTHETHEFDPANADLDSPWVRASVA